MISSADASVQIKLVFMYSIGLITMLVILGFLIHRQRRITQFTIPIMIITIIMGMILIDTITLP